MARRCDVVALPEPGAVRAVAAGPEGETLLAIQAGRAVRIDPTGAVTTVAVDACADAVTASPRAQWFVVGGPAYAATDFVEMATGRHIGPVVGHTLGITATDGVHESSIHQIRSPIDVSRGQLVLRCVRHRREPMDHPARRGRQRRGGEVRPFRERGARRLRPTRAVPGLVRCHDPRAARIGFGGDVLRCIQPLRPLRRRRHDRRLGRRSHDDTRTSRYVAGYRLRVLLPARSEPARRRCRVRRSCRAERRGDQEPGRRNHHRPRSCSRGS